MKKKKTSKFIELYLYKLVIYYKSILEFDIHNFGSHMLNI